MDCPTSSCQGHGSAAPSSWNATITKTMVYRVRKTCTSCGESFIEDPTAAAVPMCSCGGTSWSVGFVGPPTITIVEV